MEPSIISIVWQIFRRLWQEGKIFVRQYREENEIVEFLSSQQDQYKQKFINQYCRVRIFEDIPTMRRQIELHRLLVEPRLLNSEHIQTLPSLSNSIQSGIEVADEIECLLIHSQTGLGKSAFLKWLFLEVLRGNQNFSHSCIPVFIPGYKINSADIKIESLIEEEFVITNFPYAARFVEEALRGGYLLILIDAINEIPENHRNQAITKIQNFLHKYDKNRFVISCNTQDRHIYNGRLGNIEEREIASFNDEQMQLFIYNWFQFIHRPDCTAESLWVLLQETANYQLKDRFRIPLYLAYLCIRYQQSFPIEANFLNDLDLQNVLQDYEN